MTGDPQVAHRALRHRLPRPRWPARATWLRLLAAPVAGLVLCAAYPPRNLWWLAPIAFALWCATLYGRRARAGFGYGLLFGLAWMLPLMHWLDALLHPQFGPWPWLALASASALLVAVAGTVMAVVSSLPSGPVLMASLFVGYELLRQYFPFDGFPWGRVAFSQPVGAYLPLASLGGAPALTFAVVLSGAGLAVLGHRLLRRSPGRTRWRGATAATLVPVVAGLATWPAVGTAAQDGTETVAAVQGNAPDIGLGMLNAGDVLWRNHVAQARSLAASVAAGRTPAPDLVVFPESVADLRQPDSAVVGQLADLVGAPIALGARIDPPQGKASNTIVGWNPAKGYAGSYVKQKLVPFGEYVPVRAIAGWLTPFVNRMGDMRFGDRPGVMRLGDARVGFAICYEVAYDGPARGAVTAGAELLAVPTNNEWYGRTDASYQQLGMARVRAVEHGRAVVVAATTGVSAIVLPDGSLAAKSELFTPTTLVAQVPLRTGITLADRVGAWPEWALTLLGLAGLVVGAGRRTRIRRGR